MAKVQEKLAPTFTADDLRRRAKTTLLSAERMDEIIAGEKPTRGDWDLNPDLYDADATTRANRPAAVLVPIVDREPEATVLLTLRTQDLPNHPGQIAFPGGKVEESDGAPSATALREAREEIGLESRHVDLIGFLDLYHSRTGYLIAPAVGIVSPHYTLNVDTTEVADAFEVPLQFLMTAANHKLHSREWKGQQRHFYAMPYEDRYIWGVTAGILRNLYDWLYR